MLSADNRCNKNIQKDKNRLYCWAKLRKETGILMSYLGKGSIISSQTDAIARRTSKISKTKVTKIHHNKNKSKFDQIRLFQISW